MRGRTFGRVAALLSALLLGLVVIPASAGPSATEPGAVRAYFFGDSLMNGTGSSPRRPVMARVAAARLGWNVEVDAWGGTGYTTTGSSPGYLERLKRPGALRHGDDLHASTVGARARRAAHRGRLPARVVRFLPRCP